MHHLEHVEGTEYGNTRKLDACNEVTVRKAIFCISSSLRLCLIVKSELTPLYY